MPCSELLGYAQCTVLSGLSLSELSKSRTGQLPKPTCNTLTSYLEVAFLRKQG